MAKTKLNVSVNVSTILGDMNVCVIFRVHHKWTVNAMQTVFSLFKSIESTRTTLEAETQKPTVLIDLFCA